MKKESKPLVQCQHHQYRLPQGRKFYGIAACSDCCSTNGQRPYSTCCRLYGQVYHVQAHSKWPGNSWRKGFAYSIIFYYRLLYFTSSFIVFEYIANIWLPRKCPSGGGHSFELSVIQSFTRITVWVHPIQNRYNPYCSLHFQKEGVQGFFVLFLCCKISSLQQTPWEVRVSMDVEGQQVTPEVPSPSQVLLHTWWIVCHDLSSWRKCPKKSQYM